MTSSTLLCIGDNQWALEFRKQALESNGHHVKLARDAHAAMKILDSTSTAAVLMEYKQEGIDAEAIARKIKQRYPTLPVILVSAYSDTPERIFWFVDAFVLKSELPEGLFRSVGRIFTQRKASSPMLHPPRRPEISGRRSRAAELDRSRNELESLITFESSGDRAVLCRQAAGISLL